MLCIRCLTWNEQSELRKSKKVKGLSHTESKKIKTCKNCNCRVFYSK